jgi:hypothetical protein
MSLFPLESFDHYWNMWNEPDVERVREHLDRAVTQNFIFCDPLEYHVGRDALEQNVVKFRGEYPEGQFETASGFDNHHNRYRYRWNFTMRGKVFVEGLDVTTVAENGLIERIDGFFGPMPEQ